ncbi:MAG: DUF3761 domain-containing protein [Gemmatimonadota bacterium]|nr:DUF3761 domain-containing protein [Gemmatimonadota bacterium]
MSPRAALLVILVALPAVLSAQHHRRRKATVTERGAPANETRAGSGLTASSSRGSSSEPQTATRAPLPLAIASLRCADGSYSLRATRRFPCRSHGGVADRLRDSSLSARADTTARCRDGSYWVRSKRAGACSGHGGVKEWR